MQQIRVYKLVIAILVTTLITVTFWKFIQHQIHFTITSPPLDYRIIMRSIIKINTTSLFEINTYSPFNFIIAIIWSFSTAACFVISLAIIIIFYCFQNNKGEVSGILPQAFLIPAPIVHCLTIILST